MFFAVCRFESEIFLIRAPDRLLTLDLSAVSYSLIGFPVSEGAVDEYAPFYFSP
jgi:hypothetical protein